MIQKKYDVFMPKTSGQLESFLQQILKKNAKNIIIRIIPEYIGFDELLMLFNKYQTQIKHYKRNKSIVFQTENFDYDLVPGYISIAPTEEEALDIMDFEEIERDLSMED